MSHADFISNSNKRAQEPRRWCMKHPLGYWGNDQWGNPYMRCSVGHKVNEDCEEGKNE